MPTPIQERFAPAAQLVGTALGGVGGYLAGSFSDRWWAKYAGAAAGAAVGWLLLLPELTERQKEQLASAPQLTEGAGAGADAEREVRIAPFDEPLARAANRDGHEPWSFG